MANEPLTGSLGPATTSPAGPLPAVPAVAAIRQRAARDGGMQVTPLLAWRAACQWWKVVVPLGLVSALVSGALIWVWFEPQYRASVWVQIELFTPYLAYKTRQEEEKSEQSQFVNTQIELMRSPLVLGPLVSKPEIASLPEVRRMKEPVTELRSWIQVVPVGSSQLYEVVVEGPDPKNAAQLVNAVVDGYFELLERLKVDRQQRVIELLDQERERLGSQVEILRQRMHALGKEILGRDPFTGTPTAEAATKHPLAVVHDRLITAEAEAKILEVQVQAFEESLAKDKAPLSESMIEAAIDQSPEVQETQALLAAKRAKLERIETTAKSGKDDPAYRRLSDEIADYENSLRQLRETVRPRVTETLRARVELEQTDELKQLRSQLSAQKVLEQMLSERYAAQLKELGVTGERSLDLEFTRAALAREEKVYELIADRVMALRTEIRAPGRVISMQRATPPERPVEAFPFTAWAIAALASFGVPLIAVVLWEAGMRRITTSRQLEQLTNLPLLAEVPRLPYRKSDRTGGSLDRRAGRAVGMFEESIDSLRTCLVLPAGQRPVQVFAVTSAVPDEGKTSLATQLVVSLARAKGQPTLIIDADLRSPDVYHIFHVANEPGLAKLLDDQCSLDEAIDTSWSNLVHVLPAGQLHKSPHELFGNGRFTKLLHELRGRYAHVVIDTPPILAASESLVISKHSDGTILCAMRGRSRVDQVRLAHKRLSAAGGNPLGAVLNAVPAGSYAFTYGAYSYRQPSN